MRGGSGQAAQAGGREFAPSRHPVKDAGSWRPPIARRLGVPILVRSIASTMGQQEVEHPPLTRLMAMFYFMGSSMLVQYTTKASRDCWDGGSEGEAVPAAPRHFKVPRAVRGARLPAPASCAIGSSDASALSDACGVAATKPGAGCSAAAANRRPSAHGMLVACCASIAACMGGLLDGCPAQLAPFRARSGARPSGARRGGGGRAPCVHWAVGCDGRSLLRPSSLSGCRPSSQTTASTTP